MYIYIAFTIRWFSVNNHFLNDKEIEGAISVAITTSVLNKAGSGPGPGLLPEEESSPRL